MSCWSQFSEGDRCSLGPDWLETWWQLDSRQVTWLWYEEKLSSAGSCLGRQHEDNHTEEQTRSDRLPGDPVQRSLSQTRVYSAIYTFHVQQWWSQDSSGWTDAWRRLQCWMLKRRKLANSYLYIRLELATCPGGTSPALRWPRAVLTDHKWISDERILAHEQHVSFSYRRNRVFFVDLCFLFFYYRCLMTFFLQRFRSRLTFLVLNFHKVMFSTLFGHEFNRLSIWISLTRTRRFPSASFPLTCRRRAVAKSNFSRQ